SATMSVRAWGTCATTIRDSCTLGFISYISAFLFSPTLYAPVLCLLLSLPLSLSLAHACATTPPVPSPALALYISPPLSVSPPSLSLSLSLHPCCAGLAAEMAG